MELVISYWISRKFWYNLTIGIENYYQSPFITNLIIMEGKMRKLKSLVLMLVAILSLSVLTGCSSNNESSDKAETRVVKTEKGDVEIPANPKRIVDISGSSEELAIRIRSSGNC